MCCAAIASALMQVAMRESLPGLINALKMIFSISSYYNTPEQLNHLLAAVSLN